MIRFILGLLLTSFFPGLALTYMLFRKRELSAVEKICYSFGLSLVITIILGFLLPKLNIFSLLFHYSIFFLLSSPLIIFRYLSNSKKGHTNEQIRKYLEEGQKQYPLTSLKSALIRQGATENQID
ncbi:DUF1616 domain-containing protein, partial [Candidatus Woesearchaeota archaeon]|nr:DUF1616 domain-containing protein [Candidatus Woesearchaeota archaeon]